LNLIEEGFKIKQKYFFAAFLVFLVAHFQFYQCFIRTLLQSTAFLSFSGSLKLALHGNLEFFRFTETCFALKYRFFPVHSNVLCTEILSFSGSLKPTRIQCSGARCTEKNKACNQKCKKNRKNSGCSLHLFSVHYETLYGHKMVTKEQYVSTQ